MKILREGHKSIHDSSVWVPREWREELDAQMGGACGMKKGNGFHSIICGDPLKAPVFCWPCEVWEDECEQEMGRDKIKARYRRQRVTEDITDTMPIVVEMNAFIRHIPEVHWFEPQDDSSQDWMRVEPYPTLIAAWNAAGNGARNAGWDAAGNAAGNAAWNAAGNAARDAAWNAAGNGLAFLVADLNIDTTWLKRWWKAWELGYYPIREDGDKLVVGKIG